MKKVGKQNLERAISIAAQAFRENKSMLWFTGNDPGEKKLRELCQYCIVTAAGRDGAWLSEDGNGLALFYPSQKRCSWSVSIPAGFRFIFRCTGIIRLPSVIHRQRVARSLRRGEPHMYVLMIASNKSAGPSSAYELRDAVFNAARRSNLPLYAETSLLLNKKVYERFGFMTYASMQLENSDTTLWFMKRPAEITTIKSRSNVSH